ncbi:hypothetical protein LE181_12790 [Streptomyces sp. SCA3-4]|uniref:DUF6255 family natural product biosynthesis protein n=1 Tax=Streptomyces sichuanensis TaxID=2871810 RepID=UPI001CE2C90B|nr:DUF6255 family natural product biosynthesis protein [Streptomyces sichuanensis]MCA6093035.1 hypothetical protein [Streptomyces sichuanensis]
MTVYAAGRLVTHCPHAAGWTRTAGEARCERCGVRRFTEYGAVRPSGLPQAVVPSPRARRAADRAAARNVAIRWGRR